ncbi:hypothetical protein BK709_19050 [Bacillus thuringiensis serovar shandongiensis]|nr:hypothetical protein BK717_04460 [Bacillus thuringiensis serovar malayensis]OUB05073.1 hypothetical protein BK709_19050 [Bacillus thuringiensis serovar shandongiensis]
MASVIDIIIQAQDRASNKFRSTAAEANKMAAIIGTIGVVGSGALVPLLGGLGAVVSLFGTAGLAAAGFGALAFTTISKTIETANQLEEAQLKANAALIAGDTKGYAKQMALVQAIMEDLTAEEKKAVVAINQLSDAWREMENKMAPTTLNLLANSTDFLRLTMTKLFPSFQGVGQSFSNMIGKMNDGITQGKADKFFEHMNTFAVPMFEMVMKSAGNILKGFGDIMIAFTPLGMQLGAGMVDLTQKFANWAVGLQSNKAFQDFVSMVQTSTPVVMGFIGQLIQTLWKIMMVLAPLGVQVFELGTKFLKWAEESGALDTALNVVSTAVQFLIDNASTLVPIIVGAWAAFQAIMGIVSLVGIIGSVVTAFKAINSVLKITQGVMMLARGAMLLFNATLWANPITWVVAAIVALIAVGVLLYKNWDEITAWCKKMWDTMKRKYEEGKKSVTDAYNGMIQSVKDWWNDTKQKWNDMVDTVKNKAEEMKVKAIAAYENMKREAVQKVVNMAQGVKDKFEELKSSATQKIQDMKTSVVNKYEELKNSAVEKLRSMVSDARGKFQELVQAAKDKVSSMASAGKEMLSGFKNAVVEGFNKAVDSVYKGVDNMYKQVKVFFKTFYNSGKGLLSEFVDGIKSGFGKAVSAVSEGMSKVRSYLPFSPAKKGPLSDLDKSGKAFFPTWYEAALTQVSKMERTMGGAFEGVASQASVALAGTGLEAFTGGRTAVTVKHVHEHKGTVGVDGSDLKEQINQTVIQTTNEAGYTGGMNFRSVNQTIRGY